jgi:hypothetical protein
VVVVLGVAITALALMKSEEAQEAAATTPPTIPSAPAATGPLATTANPSLAAQQLGTRLPVANPGPEDQNREPWEYDAATNRHWDPNHRHWHEGPPPARAADGTPEPWQYDPATNKHWDPRHGHWHSGPPPENPPPTPPTPQ